MELLSKRYISKLFSNLLRIPANLLLIIIAPRALGISLYGDFNFITDFFTKFLTFLNLGTLNAFYTKLSKNLNDFKIVRFYGSFILLKSFIAIILVLFVFLFEYEDVFWPNQKPIFIFLGVFWGILYWIDQVIHRLLDALGLTVESESALIKKSIVSSLVIVSLFYFDTINLLTFYLYHISMFFFIFFLWNQILNKHNLLFFKKNNLSFKIIKKYTYQFYTYSYPLFIGGIFALIIGLLDRWLLQFYFGSVQQGSFSFALKISALGFLFTSTMVPLFTRELSVISKQVEKSGMRNLYLRFVPMFYSISTFIGVFFYFHSETITTIFGGSSFQESRNVVAIMSFYPIHQTFGQMNSAVFFATERTALYRNIGFFSNILGLFLTLLLLIPNTLLNIGSGATGLAMKMLFLQVISTNILSWYNSKYLQISYIKILKYQLIPILSSFLLVYISLIIAKFFTNKFMLLLMASALIYLVFLVMMVYSFPSIIRSERREIKEKLKFLMNFLNLNS